MAVATNLKKIRQEQKIYQKDIAKATGMCVKSISNIERGEYNPSLETALLLARFLNVKVEDLFTLEGKRLISGWIPSIHCFSYNDW